MRRKGGMRKLLLKLYFILSYAIKEEEIKELRVPLHLNYSDFLDEHTSFVLYLNRFSGQLINKV